MLKHKRSTRVALLVGMMLMVLSAACTAADSARGRFERTLTVTGPAEVDVNTGSGNITVRRGDSVTVRVVGTIHAHGHGSGGLAPEEKVRRLEANPPIEQHGNLIHIGRIEDRELRRNVGISYELLVPAETRLRANTGSGNVSAEGLRGPVDANTGSGSIDIRQATGDIRASTGSGAIRASGIAGALRASTGSGSIQADGTLGGPWELETGSGSVTVRLPAEAAFVLDAHTGSGGVHTSHPITIVGAFDRDTLRGTVRGGGPKLTIRTGSGSTRIE